MNLIFLVQCCDHIKVYNDTEAYANKSSIYGTYTKMSESVNGRNHYQSDFNDGYYGIWWCGDSWRIGKTSVLKLGECLSFAKTSEDEKCVNDYPGIYVRIEQKEVLEFVQEKVFGQGI